MLHILFVLYMLCSNVSVVAVSFAHIPRLVYPGQLSLSSSRGRQMSSGLQLDVRHHIEWRRHLVNAYEVKAGMVFFAG